MKWCERLAIEYLKELEIHLSKYFTDEMWIRIDNGEDIDGLTIDVEDIIAIASGNHTLPRKWIGCCQSWIEHQVGLEFKEHGKSHRNTWKRYGKNRREKNE